MTLAAQTCATSLERTFTVYINSEYALAGLIALIKRTADELEMPLAKVTMLVAAACEIARNAMVHAGGGVASVSGLAVGRRSGVRVAMRDQGPGIDDVARALQDGYSTAESVGLGLGAAKRLVDRFEIRSDPESGTQVTLTAWL